MVEVLLENHWERVAKYAQQENIPMTHAAEELVEGLVMCGDAEALKRECIQKRLQAAGALSPQKTIFPENCGESPPGKTDQWNVKVITKEVKKQWKERKMEKKKKKGEVTETFSPQVRVLETIEPEGISVIQSGE